MADIARKVGSKDSRFCVFVYIPSLRSRARVLFAFTSAKRLDRQNKRNGGLLTRSLSSFATLWRERRKSENPRRSFWSREGRMGFGRDSMDNRKLEDLVRLALKRLNVSYLTIMSRLVWFQREMPCVSRTWTQEKLVFSNLQTIKLYLIIII